MNTSLRAWVGCASALAACILSLPDASALEPPDDGPRFRGGIAAQIGPTLFTTRGQVVFSSGLQGHVGVQLSDTVGLYWGPRVEVLAGDLGGPYLGSPILIDFTSDDFVAFGLGPEIGYYAQVVSDIGPISSPQLGGLLHLAFYPERDRGSRRSGLVVGADLGIRLSGAAYAACGGCPQAEGPPMVIAPAFFIGHEAY